MVRIRWTAILLGAAFLLGGASPARAWGCRGHQAVAHLAEKYLTPEARQMVEKLLSANPIDPKLKRWCGNATTNLMVDAATWADDARQRGKDDAWHYVDIPRGTKRNATAIEDVCKDAPGCVIRAMEAQSAILRDNSADPARRADALRYLVHFTGDLHQPLHSITNGDRGGNCVPVKFFRSEPQLGRVHPERESYSPNLHEIWDTEIVERDMEVPNPARYADDLDGEFKAKRAEWERAGIHLDDWAWESHEAAEKIVYGRLGKIEIEPDPKMESCADNNHMAQRMLQKRLAAGENYQRISARIVREQIAKAGVRLAMILNDAAK
jgi:hypothetical protein